MKKAVRPIKDRPLSAAKAKFEFFDEDLCGRLPIDLPKIRWDLVSTSNDTGCDIPVIRKQIVGHVDDGTYSVISVDVQPWRRRHMLAGPVPVIFAIYLRSQADGCSLLRAGAMPSSY